MALAPEDVLHEKGDASEEDPAQLPSELPGPGGNFMHGLIGRSLHGFSETVRHSISPSLARKDADLDATAAALAVAAAGTKPDNNNNNNNNHHSNDGNHHNIHHPLRPALLPAPAPPLPPPPPKRRSLHLLALPAEIQLLILKHADFASILRLGTTCKHFHHLTRPAQIRILRGTDWLHAQLASHCERCLLYDAWRTSLLEPHHVAALSPPPGPDPEECYVLWSRCLDCAIQLRDPRIRAGRKIRMAAENSVCVCRWCGYPFPFAGDEEDVPRRGRAPMHRECLRKYTRVVWVFRFVLGVVQFGLGVVATALAWWYFRDRVLVLGPTAVSLLSLSTGFYSWVCCCV
jgi:hypothetical protein